MAGSLSTAFLTGTTAGVVILVTLGLARAARKSGLPRSLAPSAAAGMVLWLGAAAAPARGGALSARTASPPRWPLLPLIALGTLAVLGLTPTFRRLIAEVPPWLTCPP